MKSSLVKVVLVSTGAVLFNIFFWNEKLALNGLLFDAFTLTALFYLYPASLNKATVRWLLTAHIIALATVLIHNTVLSKLAFTSTLLLLVVFVQYLHRSLWYAGASAALNYILLLPSFWSLVKGIKTNGNNSYGVRKALRFLIIPLLLLIAFVILYNFANSVFSQIINDAGLAISRFFSNIFNWVSWERCWFLLLGLVVTGGLLLKTNTSYFSTADLKQPDNLIRKKNNLQEWKKSNWFELLTLLMGRFANGAMALRNENTTGIISLLLLNILLLFINAIDVLYVWFGFTYNNNINLSEYVHEGAGLLIFSIVLAMLLLLFFFRGNLNFYKKNKWLKQGAYLWIIQNSILVISVLIRDYYYIIHYGLAYKRIGVLVFLLMVLMGLITVFIKIQQQKTNYFLLKVNAWFAIIVLVLASCIHWDETIAGYNLARKNSIALDVKFLLTLSDKTLPLLEKNQDVLTQKQSGAQDSEGDYLYRSNLSFKQLFDKRKADFILSQNNYSWLSWNHADAYTREQLSGGNATSFINH